MERQQIDKQKAEHRAEVRKANKEKRAAAGQEAHREGLREHKKENEAPAGEDETTTAGKRKRKSGVQNQNKKAKSEVS